MKRYRNLSLKMLLCAIAFVMVSSVYAGSFWKSWMKPFSGPDQNITTLLVTGNYSQSRMLAELIQRYSKQPILLTPASGGNDVYFMPPEKRSKSLQIPSSEITNFVNFVGAKQIIIIGDSQYVPEKYVKLIPSNQVVWRVTGQNWDKVAASMGKFLNLTNISSDYKELQSELKSETNYERVSKDSSPAPAFEEEKSLNDIEIVPAKPEAKPVEVSKPEIIDASQK
ncbi:MAG: hypothetical protein GY756_03280 [bacterium]|nr:hypothetical protein [bacterium]